MKLLVFLTVHVVVIYFCLMYIDYLRLSVSFKFKRPRKFTILKILFVISFIPFLNYVIGLIGIFNTIKLGVLQLFRYVKKQWSKLEDKYDA